MARLLSPFSDGLAILLEIAEQLIVRAVFLNDVDHVPYRTGKGTGFFRLRGCRRAHLLLTTARLRKSDRFLRRLHPVIFEHPLSQPRQISLHRAHIQYSDRSVEQRADIR